jgi:hypothetical protein
MTEAVLTHRGKVYREALDGLTDESWLYAVREAVRCEKWFPSVAGLLDYANDAPPAPTAGLLGAGDCQVCDGTGFEIVERDGREWARRCACRPYAEGAPA